MTKVLITGSNGQLGNEIRVLAPMYPAIEMTFTDVDELDICDAGAVDAFVNASSFDVVINCAAYTAVDKAETDKDLAFRINALAVGNLARACAKKNICLVHVSTDYVFDGTNHKPYTESDPVKPLGAYGLTKWQGEEEVRQHAQNAVIIRTSWLYSSFGHNFVKTILRLAAERDSLGIVFDQVGTPTYAADLAKVILDGIPKFLSYKEIVTFHFSNEGVASWYDLAYLVVKSEGLHCRVSPILSAEYPTAAARPHYSVLDKTKIKKELQINIPDWHDGLTRCLEKIRDIQ